MDRLIQGVNITPLKIIPAPNGNILHALKSTEDSCKGFGEAYFSTVHHGKIKGWKSHTRMTLNLVVPVGGIRFVVYDDREGSDTFNAFNQFDLGPELHYARLTVPPLVWMAFQGLTETTNMLLNMADLEHDPTEARNLPIDTELIPKYNWQ